MIKAIKKLGCKVLYFVTFKKVCYGFCKNCGL